MAILHGSWVVTRQGASIEHQNGYLFIWGETWRRMTPDSSGDALQVASHPLAMTPAELGAFLKVLQQSDRLNWEVPEAPLPGGKENKRQSKNQNSTPPAAPGKKGGSKTQNQISPWQSQAIALPTHIPDTGDPVPLHSAAPTPENGQPAYLYPWQVQGLCLDALEAMKFLQALPLGAVDDADSFVGADLRFWSHMARWSLDLLARCKFLPGLERQSDIVAASWLPLLDSATDSIRLTRFAKLMPLACRTYQGAEEQGSRGAGEQKSRGAEEQGSRGAGEQGRVSSTIRHPLSVDLPPEPQELLRGFLDSTIDARIRTWAVSADSPPAVGSPVRDWLVALGALTPRVQAAPAAIEKLEAALNAWTSPVQPHLAGQQQFRTCFVLHPPTGDRTWTLEYCLQAADDADFLVDAKTIWNNPVEKLVYLGRTIERPQETLLSGLGLASRLYPAIEESLHASRPFDCAIAPMQAYEFLKTSAWRFQDSGLGVVLPPGLANSSGWANGLGLSIRAETPTLPKGGLGLQSLLNFKWELTIGGQRISKREFDRLVALKSPLVEINGEWVELRDRDIRAAVAFFASRKDQVSLSLEDALRLATGDTQTIEKLPVVNFEAGGQLQELLNTLTNNQTLEAIAPPATFAGQLRPYQARGLAWLSFLQRWGLGACLADDMGLGKCLSADTFVHINGMLRTAEEIWISHASSETEFDGEGFWAHPTEPLLVNAISEESGKIVQASILRIYRQRVREKLRKVKLQDGSSITITRRHQLLTRNGWTNNLLIGDYICVPAKMLWDGQPEDPDLVKFLAWQIAEACEPDGRSTFTIARKEKERLEDLIETFQRIGQRYKLKINRPAIRTNPDKVPVLLITSTAYRRFLEDKGYQWGKRSRDKTIPPFIMQADKETVRLFLRHYFDAEAVIQGTRSMEIATASAVLIQQLAVLMRRFGIWLRIASREKGATNGRGKRTYYIGILAGNSARRFWQEMGFINSEKQRRLEEICELVANTNIEGIPASDIAAEAVDITGLPFRHLGIKNTAYIKGYQEFSHRSLELVVAAIERIISGEAEEEYRHKKPSRWTAQTLEAYARLDAQQMSIVRQRLQRLLDLEVFYCHIEEIEEVEYDGWVYDFEVKDHHNFVANNILCHNTIQTVAFMLHLQERDELEAPVLLVCPTSVLGNWEREIKKFGPTLKVLVHHGDKRPKGKAFAKAIKGNNLVITSYPLVFRDALELKSIKWEGIVLDEAQNIKNSQAKQSQAVRQLDASFRIALTGTPVENRLSELWSILDFLNPGYLGQRNFFQRRFAIPIEKYGDTDSLQTLRSLVRPFILRRMKSDPDIIQDLPEKQEMAVFCGLSAEQASLYQKNVEESLVQIESAEGLQRRGMILALLVKLKQICNHPAQFLKEGSVGDRHRSGKLQRLEEMLEEVLAEGDRALIFTQFAELGKLLKPHLEQQLGREILFLYGSTSKQQREEMIDRFQHDPQGPPIMILSLKAGGTGLNLTRATHVFHFDRWWNPAVENQATDRVFRIGQTRNVQVHKFVCNGTLEEKIHDTLEAKKALAEQVVGAGEQWLTELNTDQLRNLLILDRSAVIDEEEE